MSDLYAVGGLDFKGALVGGMDVDCDDGRKDLVDDEGVAVVEIFGDVDV